MDRNGCSIGTHILSYKPNVSLSNLKKIADGFQISIAELMRGVS